MGTKKKKKTCVVRIRTYVPELSVSGWTESVVEDNHPHGTHIKLPPPGNRHKCDMKIYTPTSILVGMNSTVDPFIPRHSRVGVGKRLLNCRRDNPKDHTQ